MSGETHHRDRDIQADRGGHHGAAAVVQQPRHHQHHRRDIGRGRPIGLGMRDETHHQHHGKRGQREDGEQGRRARRQVFPHGQRQQQQHRRKHRPEHAELREEEFDEIHRMDERAVRGRVLLGMAVGDEAVAEIPEEVRKINKQRQERRLAVARQMAALVAEQQEIEQARNQPIDHGVFRQQAQPRRGAHRVPPKPAAFLARADEGVKR